MTQEINNIKIEDEMLKAISIELKKFFTANLPLDGLFFECMCELPKFRNKDETDDLLTLLEQCSKQTKIIEAVKKKLDEIKELEIK